MKERRAPTPIERITTWIGSVQSLVIHTLIFIGSFAAVWLKLLPFDLMLLILTTALSLEAIYLAIFIQMTVNINTASLREVEEDIDEIQEDVEELGEDVDEIQEDIGEIQEDVEEMSEDLEEIQGDVEELSDEDDTPAKPHLVREGKKSDSEILERLSADVAQLLKDLEELKNKETK